MATREELLRDLILSPHGRLTIVRDTADRETRKALTSLIDADPQRATHAASELDLVVHPDDERLDAYTMHNTMAVARNILLTVTEPTPEADIVTRFAPSGFTAAMVRDGVNFLRRDGLATRREGVIAALVAPPATRPALPTELLLPRTLTQPAPAARYESAGASTPSVRRNTAIPSASDIGDLDAAPVRRNTSLGTGTASFEVGDLPEGSLNHVKKPVTEVTSVAEPTAAIIAYMGELVDCFARVGKPTASWEEVGFPFPPIADIPPSVDAAKWRQDILNEATHRLVSKGTLTRDGDTFTYVPARDAVAAVRAALDAWIADAANSDEYTVGLLRSVASQANVTTPMGWSAETLYDLAMTELLAARTLTQEGATYHRKPMPAPAQEPVKPDAPAPKPAPAAPTKPAPTVSTHAATEAAPAPAPPSTSAAPKDVPADVPVSGDIAERLAALEAKAETTVEGINVVYTKVDRIEAAVTSTSSDRKLVDAADDEVKRVLVTIAATLQRRGGTVMSSELKKSLSNRLAKGDKLPARDHFDAARALGIRSGVIRLVGRGELAFVSHEPLMPADEWSARLARMGVRAAARTKSIVDAHRAVVASIT